MCFRRDLTVGGLDSEMDRGIQGLAGAGLSQHYREGNCIAIVDIRYDEVELIEAHESRRQALIRDRGRGSAELKGDGVDQGGKPARNGSPEHRRGDRPEANSEHGNGLARMGGPRCYTGYCGACGQDVRAIGKQGYDILKAAERELTWRKQASTDAIDRNRPRVAVALRRMDDHVPEARFDSIGNLSVYL